VKGTAALLDEAYRRLREGAVRLGAQLGAELVR